MKRIYWILGIFLCAAMTACSTAQESAPEELVSITEPETEPTAAVTQPVTQPVTEPETEPETKPETLPETEPETEPTDEVTPDDDAPYLLSSQDTVQVITGELLDLNALVSFGDDHDPHPTITYEGDVDVMTPGQYPITAVLSDSEGHTRTYELRVCVADQHFRETIKAIASFDLFLAQHEGKSCGIDVSKWQGDVDFDKVREAGAEFVLMRIGYGAVGGEMDEYFSQNLRNAKAAGLKVGVYFYSTAGSADAAQGQADWIADVLNGETLDFPVAFDWENFGHFQDWGMSFETLGGIYDAFDARMRECGYETMLYAEPQMLQRVWGTERKNVWLADYGVISDYTGDYILRQVSNTGYIDGIEGDVDVNVMESAR